MDVTQTTNTAAFGSTVVQSETDASVISSDFETFLLMLTTQMENQDPLNPVESQDFATQLATFSGVEQQVKTNDLLEAMNSQVVVSALGDMASWVGMDARIAGPAYFDGSPVELIVTPPVTADKAELVVTNAQGQAVQRLAIEVADGPITWAGVGSNGSPLPAGEYSFAVESFSNDELIDTETPELYTEVEEVRSVDGAAVVVVSGGQIHPSSAVTGLR